MISITQDMRFRLSLINLRSFHSFIHNDLFFLYHNKQLAKKCSKYFHEIRNPYAKGCNHTNSRSYKRIFLSKPGSGVVY